MPRNISSAVLAEIDATYKHLILFFAGEFASGTVRLWSGIGDISWQGQTWTGAGHIGSISPITETAGVVAQGVVVSMNGIPADMTSLVLSELRQGKFGRIWMAFLSPEGVVIGDSDETFAGRLDIGTIEEDATTATVTINYEGRLRDLERPRVRRRTHEDQQQRFPGDLAFSYVTALQEGVIVWGRE